MSERNNTKDTLFAGLDDAKLLRRYYAKAKTEGVVADVMARTEKPSKERLIKPTAVRRVK